MSRNVAGSRKRRRAIWGGDRAASHAHYPLRRRVEIMSAIVTSGPAIEPGTRGSASVTLTWCLALFLTLNALALNVVLKLASPLPYTETVLNHTSDVLHAEGCDDSWGIMTYALQYERSPHTTPLYTELFFNQKLKFQYPPSSLFAIAGMLWLGGPDFVRTTECPDFSPASLNDVIGWLFILMTALSTAALLERGLRQDLIGPPSRALVGARVAIVLGFALTFYPLVKPFTLGQIQICLNGLFALALLYWATGKRASSGLLIGLMCLVKPHYGLFVLWAALRREWRFTAACVATGAFGLIASIAAFGWTDNVDYLSVFWFLSQHGEVYYPNQSFNGLFNRLMTLIDRDSYDSLAFDDNGFPPFSPWVYAGTLVTSAVILLAALLRRGNDGDPDRVLDFCTMALSITMASPIAWEHHYGILLPVFAILLVQSLGNRRRLVLIAVAYVLISNFFSATNLLAYSILNLAQSYLLFAAIIVLMLLHTARPGWQIAAVSLGRRAAGRDGHVLAARPSTFA
jgi:alpha-1,2-mannosyltransferase